MSYGNIHNNVLRVNLLTDDERDNAFLESINERPTEWIPEEREKLLLDIFSIVGSVSVIVKNVYSAATTTVLDLLITNLITK